MTDILGPGAFGAARAVTVRPAFSPTGAPADPDTWVKDCSSPASNDGTENRASLFNAILAALRGVIRKSGVAVDNADDGMLVRALQGGRINFGGTATGTANAPSIVLDPQPAVWADLVGAEINFIVGVTNTGPAVLAISGLTGTKPIVRPGGAALQSSDLIAGAVFRGMYDGTSIQMAGITQSTTGTVLVYGTPGSFNWTVPAGVTKIRARVWGGGGGGGALISLGGAGAGGNGGGYSEGVFAVVPGSIPTVTVGAGGAKGTAAGTHGQTGGTSSVGSLLSATGGGGGATGFNGAAGGASVTIGMGSGGQINLPGQGAANAYIIGAAYVASPGGGSYNTPGTAMSSGNSFKGMQPGGGSSGVAGTVSDAQNGADGMVIIEY